jgi:hypothetical protein
MRRHVFVSAALLCALASPLCAAPILNVVPGGVQGGNWVWDVSITPDLAIASGDTPMAVELGLRLTGAGLTSATIDPANWNSPNPGKIIFGWETLTPSANNNPVGLQTNTNTDEIFVAYGSVNFSTPGAKPFLKILTEGPQNGGAALSSTIEWLGVYAVGHGRIAQLINGGSSAGNFDIYAGTATQRVPEPMSAALLAFGAVIVTAVLARRRLRTSC